MTLALRFWPDKVLRVPCSTVSNVNDDIRTLVRDMLQVMYDSNGIGLAGPQVGRSLRLFVLDVWWPQTGSRQRHMAFINPVVTPVGKARTREGCLSLPGVSEFVTRGRTCHVEALDINGAPFALDAEG